MQGRILEDVARNVDAETVRQPVGVCAAIVPFNFPAMVPFWFLPVRDRLRQHLHPQALRAGAADAADRLRGARRARPAAAASSTSSTAAARSSRGSSTTRASTRSRSSARRRWRKHRLRARGQGRQARAGARRRQEPHGRHARRRDRQDRRRHHRLGASAPPASAAWPARSSSPSARRTSGCCPPLREATEALRVGDGAGRGDRRRPGRLRRGARPHPRLDRPRRGGRRDARRRRPRRRPARSRTARFVGPTILDDVTPEMADRRRRRSSARCSRVVHVETLDEAIALVNAQPLRQRHVDLHRVRRRGPALPPRGRGRA